MWSLDAVTLGHVGVIDGYTVEENNLLHSLNLSIGKSPAEKRVSWGPPLTNACEWMGPLYGKPSAVTCSCCWLWLSELSRVQKMTFLSSSPYLLALTRFPSSECSLDHQVATLVLFRAEHSSVTHSQHHAWPCISAFSALHQKERLLWRRPKQGCMDGNLTPD